VAETTGTAIFTYSDSYRSDLAGFVEKVTYRILGGLEADISTEQGVAFSSFNSSLGCATFLTAVFN